MFIGRGHNSGAPDVVVHGCKPCLRWVREGIAPPVRGLGYHPYNIFETEISVI